MKKRPVKKDASLTATGKSIIWVPAPVVKKKNRGMTAVEAVGGKPRGQACTLCGEKMPLGRLSNHECKALTKTVKVRKLSSLPRKQRYVKVKSGFCEKLSDYSGGWW